MKRIIIVLCIILLGSIGLIWLYQNNLEISEKEEKKTSIKQKGYELLGDDYCKTDHTMEIGGCALTDWACMLCGKKETNPDTNVPTLCGRCANKTNRCYKCGKLKNIDNK